MEEAFLYLFSSVGTEHEKISSVPAKAEEKGAAVCADSTTCKVLSESV